MISLILSGGVGTRLWPLSREKLPKQFAPLLEQNLFVQTAQRLQQWGEVQVCTSEKLRTLTELSIRKSELNITQAFYEPIPRNTAPAIALVCLDLLRKGRREEIVGVFPSDHWIEKPEVFKRALDLAEECAKEKMIVTIGIKPTYPATGFGYVCRKSEVFKEQGDLSAFPVAGFKEKPDRDTAESYVGNSAYCWNSGMFVFQVSTMIQAFETHMPSLWTSLQALAPDSSNLEKVYGELKSESIDYGIMEKVGNQVNIACDIGWNDLGSWDDIASLSKRLSVSSGAESLSVSSNGCFAHSDSSKLVCFLEVDDLIVVDTRDALLVTKKEKSQNVKQLVEQLKSKKPQILIDHEFEHRPWGAYWNLAEEQNFKAKVIQVDPGQQLSYQSHTKRSEVWVTVEGEGEVVLEDEVITVKPGQVVTIPVGAKHRMRNPGSRPLKFVEVQLGDYFGEDDITRYQDDYKRI